MANGPQTATALAHGVDRSRQAVHGYLVGLQKSALVRSSGNGRATRWFRLVDAVFTWPLTPGLQEDRMWAQVRSGTDVLNGLSDAALRSLSFGVSEILNNAIDHSRGSTVSLLLWKRDGTVTVEITDDGIGAFASVQKHFGLANEREAIAQIAKGKQTTAPAKHSGQGIFFTSKIFETFELESHNNIWVVDNVRDDQTIKASLGLSGTRVRMTIDSGSTLKPGDTFGQFSDPDTLEFNKSALRVSLAQHGSEFVSRSEAKRLATQLELFGEVVLDFKGVDAVGQGFVDELFRVWPNANPGTRLTPINMNDDVSFMVHRGPPGA